jgi:hypothetical protein
MSTSTTEAPTKDETPSGMPPIPPPTKEHQWLEKFVGEWISDVEISCTPGEPPMKYTGTESTRMLGGYFVIAQGKGDSTEMPYASVMTLGYDPEKQKYIGTWVDTMTSHLWKLEGTVNAAGTALTLDTEKPCGPGAVMKFKEATEFKSADHRIFTSSMQQDGGEWRIGVTIHYHRKK